MSPAALRGHACSHWKNSNLRGTSQHPCPAPSAACGCLECRSRQDSRRRGSRQGLLPIDSHRRVSPAARLAGVTRESEHRELQNLSGPSSLSSRYRMRLGNQRAERPPAATTTKIISRPYAIERTPAPAPSALSTAFVRNRNIEAPHTPMTVARPPVTWVPPITTTA